MRDGHPNGHGEKGETAVTKQVMPASEFMLKVQVAEAKRTLARVQRRANRYERALRNILDNAKTYAQCVQVASHTLATSGDGDD